MIDIQNARVNTAGAYVSIDGFYPFAIGTQLHNGHIPVVRLGGHREENETGWQCAIREVYEEANLDVKPLLPSATYLLPDGDHVDADLERMNWQCQMEGEPIPLLVVAYRRESEILLSLMYLAEATELPTPSSEIKGLLLLGQKDIHWLCQEPVTLEQYLTRGGKALLNYDFDHSLILAPFAQLRLFSKILSLRSEL